MKKDSRLSPSTEPNSHKLILNYKEINFKLSFDAEWLNSPHSNNKFYIFRNADIICFIYDSSLKHTFDVIKNKKDYFDGDTIYALIKNKHDYNGNVEVSD